MDENVPGPKTRSLSTPPRSVARATRQHYEVPKELTPREKFEHWRTWYGQAVETPVRLEETGPTSPLFRPWATSFTGPGFSVIELRNEPAKGFWNANPDSGDLRLAYFVKAPSATYNFSGEPTSISAPRVRFLDLTHKGEFRAPNGMHVVQLNLDRAALDLTMADAKRLSDIPNLIQHPVLRSLLMPVLLNCRNDGMEEHSGSAAGVLTSIVASLISSLLEVPPAPESLQWSQLLEIRKYIDRNYTSRDLAVQAITEHFHISRRTLFSHFEQEELGLGSRIRAVRTARTLELLLDKEYRSRPMDELAARSGFSNTQSLSRALKAATGLTVRDLRGQPAATAGHLDVIRRSLAR